MERVPYASTVGSLMYVMVCNCLDIGYVVDTVIRFLSNPKNEHWNAVKWIMRYLRGTSSMSLYFGCEKLELFGYTDVDMARDIDSRKSTSGYLIIFIGGIVAWQPRLQKCVTFSTKKLNLLQVQKSVRSCYG